MKVVIVDCGVGNLRSIQHKLKKIRISSTVSSKIEDIAEADRLILPGVGSFATAMGNLKKHNLITVLNRKVLKEKTPILGICLGTQLFTKRSEEGNVEGLGWLDAETKRFKFEENDADLRIPHVGWNTIRPRKKSFFLTGVTPGQRFYFTHSYHVYCECNNDVLAMTHYGYDFASAVQKENVFGVQFHPEKSHRRGVELIRNFVRGK
jgi:glutamine amidotransferase